MMMMVILIVDGELMDVIEMMVEGFVKEEAFDTPEKKVSLYLLVVLQESYKSL